MTLDLLAHVRTESDRFAAALRDADPGARVPSCPDWSAADLLWHLTEVHSMWTNVVRDRLADPGPAEAAIAPRPDTYDELLARRAAATEGLLAALEATADDVEVWTWAPEQTVGFVRRFQAHEALMHRVDAELAAGLAPSPLPADLADDGIDVVVRYSMSWRPAGAPWQLSDAVGLLHATDTGSRRLVRLGTWGGTAPDGSTHEADATELVDDAEPTFTVSAPAADLDAWLWGRPGFGDVTSTGDEAHGARFAALVANGVQ